MQASKRVLRYLKGTQEYGIAYKRSTKTVGIVAFSDTDWAGDESSAKSTSGFVCLLDDVGLVSWGSRLQHSPAVSTVEAEYVGISVCAQEVLYLQNVMNEINLWSVRELHIFSDNQGAIHLANNANSHKRTKHIHIRFHFVRHYINNGTIRIHYVNTNDNLADFMTKAVPVSKLVFCISKLSLKSSLNSSC